MERMRKPGSRFHHLGVMLSIACVAIVVPSHRTAAAAGAPAVETPHLVVTDEDRQMGPEELRRFADAAESAYLKALDFWEIAGRDSPPRIHLELYRGGRRSYSVFGMERGAWEPRRVVRVYGIRDPEEMVHKMTHAIFPTPDKLARNMMGIPAEIRLGNLRSFPMCGFPPDAWVAAIRRSGSYIPLRELGERHEDWGMVFVDGKPSVADRKLQHASYNEAGSFGAFLIGKFGVGKVKDFHRRSRGGGRPWKEAFGVDLGGLESQWLASIDRYSETNKELVDSLSRLWSEDPNRACDEARDKATRK